MPKFQTAYSKRVVPETNTGETMTEQSHKNLTDINAIMAGFQRTGILNHVNQNPGTYDDVPSEDYESAMNTIASVQNMFTTLPSSIRMQFGNNVDTFLKFVENPSNIPAMEEMGIVKGVDGLDINGAPTRAYEALQAVQPHGKIDATETVKSQKEASTPASSVQENTPQKAD